MKKLRVAINGFGRIGRVLTRLNHKLNIFDLVMINDINSDVNNLLYLLKYDSVYGSLNDHLETRDSNILVIGKQCVKVYSYAKINEIPWKDLNIDVIVDASGVSNNIELLSPFSEYFSYYISTTEGKQKCKTIICDVNSENFNPAQDKYLASSTCDAVALTPILKSILKTYQISSGSLVTLHPWLSDQKLLDSRKSNCSNIIDSYSLSRSAPISLIPKNTSALSAAAEVLPGVDKFITSFSYRVPTTTVSSGVLTLTLNDSITENQLYQILNEFKLNQKYLTLDFNYDPTVSIDFSGSRYASIVDLRWSKVNAQNLRLVYWYDNEWGYSSKTLDLIHLLSKG